MVWPALHFSLLSRAMNFETGALRKEFARSRAELQGGGAVPPLGQGAQRGLSFTRDGWASSAAGSGTQPVLGGAVALRRASTTCGCARRTVR